MFRGLVAAVLSLIFAFPLVSAFTYSFGTPSECDNVPLTWTGGTPPFQLLIIPVFGTPRNISIPSSSFSNGKGSYSFQLPMAKDSQMVLSMSDATGFNTGGSTNVLTVKASQGGSCNTTDPGVSFSFQLNSALQQCRPFVFSGYTQAVQPVSIYGVIPGGNSFSLSPPTGPTSFSWDASVARGTSMIFFMTDSQGRQGGSSDVRIVGFSDDSSCLTGLSPSSTQSPPGASQTAPSTTASSTPPPTSTSPSSNGISIAAIAGTVIGALLFLAVVITLGLFFLRKKRDATGGIAPNSFKRHSRRMGSGIDLTYDPSQAPPGQPYGMPQNNAVPTNYPHSPSSGPPFSDNPFYDSPPESQYQPSSHYLPPSQFDAASQYSSGRYQFSDNTAPQEYNPYQQHHGAYQANAQLYPPNPNYQPVNTHSVDAFSSPPLALAGAQPERFSMQTSQPSAPSEVQSSAQRKAAMAGVSTTYTPSRFIVHTDVEDALPPPNEAGVVELPPQYSERRGPVVVNPTSPGASGKPPGPPYS
ncbi:hypothetical protein M413DRAFT_16245 [Hebeloma cylindrosporum]|uniref:Mid2 domain-containing protein n=1 Tax=Hebeloma cylindrosporum TaxID=76867 RepID=A0A0C2YES4_HEBCY|nr:hypothetical protein M413DRAFT_16245 [Hebeloma cylindrosporum h7]